MTAFVQIAVNLPAVAGVYDYDLPPELAGRVGLGCLVTVPFGAQTVQGVILRFVERPAVAATKAVNDLLDPQPVLTPEQIALAEWMAGHFLAPLAAMIGLMLPPGLGQQADVCYALEQERRGTKDDGQWSTVQRRLVNLLRQRGPLRGRQIDRHFGRVDWRKSAEALVRRGLLTRRSVLPPPSVRPKFIRTAQLAVAPQVAEAAMPDLGKTEATLKRRQTALRYLIRELDEVNVAWVYAESGCTLADLQELAERELIVLRETEVWRDPLKRLESGGSEKGQVTLTAEQQAAWEMLAAGFRQLAGGEPLRPFLLQGVTGSGKTELYLRAAEEAARRGRQAIVLVPEIALTPQTVQRFLARFPGQVGLIHSRLSEGERYDTWRRARLGLLKVVIGPRSALFTPLPNVGLIVLDECHDGSYYQSEPPFYHAVTVAQTYARLCGAICLLGSATPSVVQRYQAEVGESVRLELPGRISAAAGTGCAQSLDLPPIHIVDMRAELKVGNRHVFSRALLAALDRTLAAGEQAILFLNRRGTATYVFCRQCGYVAKCPRCETPLTFHSERLNIQTFERSNVQMLICHHCGYRRGMPAKCPQCGSAGMRAYGLGSEKVEAEVQRLFPQARTLRWDWDTTRRKGAHEIILSHFAAHRADVLIGTQMLAKGLDLPLVTLVGIVLADVGLHLPDPFAAERVFQVLTQVAGRAGRSARGGEVILQTFTPEHYAIRAAAGHDVAGFYAQELAQRRRLGYPPCARLVRLEYRHADAQRAEETAGALAGRLMKRIEAEDRRQTEIIGPLPCFFARLGGLYRWQIVLRGPQPETLVSSTAETLARAVASQGWRVEVEPVSLL